eukprot:2407829-Prymnesium_polylepis.1
MQLGRSDCERNALQAGYILQLLLGRLREEVATDQELAEVLFVLRSHRSGKRLHCIILELVVRQVDRDESQPVARQLCHKQYGIAGVERHALRLKIGLVSA